MRGSETGADVAAADDVDDVVDVVTASTSDDTTVTAYEIVRVPPDASVPRTMM